MKHVKPGTEGAPLREGLRLGVVGLGGLVLLSYVGYQSAEGDSSKTPSQPAALSITHPKEYISLGTLPSKAYVETYQEIPGGPNTQCAVINKGLGVFINAKGYSKSPEVSYLAPNTAYNQPNMAIESNLTVEKVDGDYILVDEQKNGLSADPYISNTYINVAIHGDKLSLNGASTGPIIYGTSAYSSPKTLDTSFTLHPNQAKGGALGGMDYAIENLDGKFYMADGCNETMQKDIIYHLNNPNEPTNSN